MRDGSFKHSGPQSFWHHGPVPWKKTFPLAGGGCGGTVLDDSNTLHLLCTLFLLLLHHLHLRSSGIRSQRLGTPALTDWKYSVLGEGVETQGTHTHCWWRHKLVMASCTYKHVHCWYLLIQGFSTWVFILQAVVQIRISIAMFPEVTAQSVEKLVTT